MRPRAIPAIASLLLAAASATAGPILIAYDDGQGIRRLSGGTLGFLNVFAVKLTSFEDRTVLEYPLSSLQGAVTEAYLDLWISNFDPGGAVGVIDVYAYEADGEIVLSEFFSGTYFTSFAANSQPNFVSVDITGLIGGAVMDGWSHIGFRLSTFGLDRFLLGSAVLAPEPRLRVIPEPASAACFVVVLVALASHRSTPRSRKLHTSA